MNRRDFIRTTGTAAALSLSTSAIQLRAQAADASPFRMDLTFGKLGVGCEQRKAVELAARFGYATVGANTGEVARMSDSELDELNDYRKSLGVAWSSSGLPVEFRKDEDTFQQGLKSLAESAPKLGRLGVPFMGTWLMPSHEELTYRENFSIHARRLKAMAAILADQGMRLALEYVGTQFLRFNRKHAFVHTAAETLELIGATDAENIGLICDCWHWWTSGESAEDLKKLKGDQIIWLELNDAPEGLAREYQIDNQRRLPASTGVIPVGQFLNAVASTGFSGPVMAEPFYPPLRKHPVDEVARRVAASLREALGQASS